LRRRPTRSKRGLGRRRRSTYPSRRRRGRRISNRKILNLTSTKKVDRLQPVVVAADGTGATGPLLVGTGFASLFIASARNQSLSDWRSVRNTSTCYIRGYKEKLNITIGGGGTWSWRRIVFYYKGPLLRNAYSDTGAGEQYDTLGSGAGGIPQRAIGPISNAVQSIIEGILFAGSGSQDWNDSFRASVDTSRVTLHSDKIKSFNPSNESGRVHNANYWYPVNKNIVYDDDESGQSRVSSPYSVSSKAGCGDLYVYDLVRLETPATTGEASFKFWPEASFYWHEK